MPMKSLSFSDFFYFYVDIYMHADVTLDEENTRNMLPNSQRYFHEMERWLYC